MDPSVLRRRRTVEACTLLSRGSGLGATVLFVAGLLGGPWGAPASPVVRAVCLVGIVLMAAACLLTAHNLRRPSGPEYLPLSTAQVVFDTIAIGGIVTAVQASTGQTTWPLLTMAVVIGALRLRLAGALAVWAMTSGWLATAGHVFGSEVTEPGDLLLAVALNFMVALLSGTQAGAYGRQVQELEEVRRQLHHQAHHDVLTGLPNRKQLTAFGASLDGRAAALLLLDLNGFKQVNDTRGHAAGDELLREIGRRLGAQLRDGGLAGRLGGDEFVVMLPDASPEEADGLAERLRLEIRRPVDVPGGPVSVGVSVGVAWRPAGEAVDVNGLMLAADAAMYREKARRQAGSAVS